MCVPITLAFMHVCLIGTTVAVRGRALPHGYAPRAGDYDAVCDCIQRSYAPLGSELEWQLKVRTRVQKVGESLIGALRGMADKAFPAWPAEQLQDLLRNQSIQGVLSSSVQLALMKEEPKPWTMR